MMWLSLPRELQKILSILKTLDLKCSYTIAAKSRFLFLAALCSSLSWRYCELTKKVAFTPSFLNAFRTCSVPSSVRQVSFKSSWLFNKIPYNKHAWSIIKSEVDGCGFIELKLC